MDKAVRISLSGSSCFICLYIIFRKVEKSSSALLSGKIRADSLGMAQFCRLHLNVYIPLFSPPPPPSSPSWGTFSLLPDSGLDQGGSTPGGFLLPETPFIALVGLCSETLYPEFLAQPTSSGDSSLVSVLCFEFI